MLYDSVLVKQNFPLMFLRCEYNLTGEFNGRYQLTTGAWIVRTSILRYSSSAQCLDRFKQKK